MERGILCFFLFVALFALLAPAPSVGHRLLRGRPVGKYGFLGLPVKRSDYYASPIAPQWQDQRLDHFDPTNTATWKQRYFVNFKFFNASGSSPVFLQLGGEGEADPIWLEEGQVATNYAKHFQAVQIYLEHRYYGKSHPTR